MSTSINRKLLDKISEIMRLRHYSLNMRTAGYALLIASSIYALTSLSGCATATRQPSLYKPNSIIRPVTAEELKKFKKEKYDLNPAQHSQEMGKMVVDGVITLNHTLGSQVAEMPFLNDGSITPGDANMLLTFYNWMKDVRFPADFAIGEKSNKSNKKAGSMRDTIWDYRVQVTWTTENADYNKGSITIMDRLGKIQLKEVKPVGFEPGDKIVSAGPYTSSSFVSIDVASSLDPTDTDGVEIKYSATGNHNLVVAIGGTYEIKRLPIAKNSQSVSNDKVSILEEMTLDGLKHDKHRYSPSLEALFWLISDGKFDAKTFPEFYRDNYDFIAGRLHSGYPGANDSLYFTLRVWGEMEGERWDKLGEVTSRLNLPELIDYYEKEKFSYAYSITPFSSPVLPETIFKDKKGSCGYYASFTAYCLNKAGYEAYAEGFWITHDRGHWTTVFKDKGKWFILDNGRRGMPLGIVGTFRSRSDALNCYR